MTLESLGKWRVDSSKVVEGSDFQDLRNRLSELLTSKGLKIRPKTVAQNLFSFFEVSYVLINYLKLPSKTSLEYKTNVVYEGADVPIEISTNRFEPYSNNPKRADIHVRVGNNDIAIWYDVAKELKDCNVAYINNTTDEGISLGGSLKLEEIRNLQDLIEKLI